MAENNNENSINELLVKNCTIENAPVLRLRRVVLEALLEASHELEIARILVEAESGHGLHNIEPELVEMIDNLTEIVEDYEPSSELIDMPKHVPPRAGEEGQAWEIALKRLYQ